MHAIVVDWVNHSSESLQELTSHGTQSIIQQLSFIMQRPLADVILILFTYLKLGRLDNKHVIRAQQPSLPLPNPQQG